jgi:predicted RNA-binding Zn ribbon-like protein
MDKNTSVATLEILGGHPSLDFANTVAARRDRWGPDLLVGYRDLVDWAERTDLLDGVAAGRLRETAAASPPESAAALARAKRLREALYVVVSALAAATTAPAEALALVHDEYLAARTTQHLSCCAGGTTWEWPRALGLDAVTHRIAVEAVDLLTSPQASRIKECLGRNCGWLFLDTSRNRSRRWCSDADCGTLDRVTRHRMRARFRAEEQS